MECALAWALPLFTLDEIVKPKEKGKKGKNEKVGHLQSDLQLRIILIAPKGSTAFIFLFGSMRPSEWGHADLKRPVSPAGTCMRRIRTQSPHSPTRPCVG